MNGDLFEKGAHLNLYFKVVYSSQTSFHGSETSWLRGITWLWELPQVFDFSILSFSTKIWQKSSKNNIAQPRVAKRTFYRRHALTKNETKNDKKMPSEESNWNLPNLIFSCSKPKHKLVNFERQSDQWQEVFLKLGWNAKQRRS